MISCIAAIDKNGAIGKSGQIPWYIPEDLKKFKKITQDSVVIMGRKTHESIGLPLPNRINIVITSKRMEKKNLFCKNSIEDALSFAKEFDKDIFIIGGENVYKSFIPKCNFVFLTLVETLVNDADAFFPVEDMFKFELENIDVGFDKNANLAYSFITYKK